MSAKILEPAMTPEEWAQVGDGGRFGIAWTQKVVAANTGADDYLDSSLTKGANDRHAIAALALHGQPFGFTWEDVDALEVVYRRIIAQPEPLGPELARAVEQMYDHVARIAAVLPPR